MDRVPEKKTCSIELPSQLDRLRRRIWRSTVRTLAWIEEDQLFDMTDSKGIHKYAIYSSIAVHNAANKYRLDLGAYSGTASDGMRACGSIYTTMMVCHSQHLTVITIKGFQETVLSPSVQDGGSISARVQT